MIFETVVSTLSPEGEVHLAPMGVRYEGEGAEAVVVLMPFKPSKTLDNILATRCAVLNLTTDVRVFAGCVTGRRDWPMVALDGVGGDRAGGVLRHSRLRLAAVACQPFSGFGADGANAPRGAPLVGAHPHGRPDPAAGRVGPGIYVR